MKQFFFSLVLMVYTFISQAQAPNSINYQGVARNAAGLPYANQPLNVKLTVRTGAPAGGVEYSETRPVTTNAFGLFNLQVGSAGATINYGTFATINWQQGIKYLQTEISMNGQPFTDLGTTQIMSVPYALHSREAKDLIMPFSKTAASTGDLLHVNNTETFANSTAVRATIGSGKAFYGTATTGYAGYFQSNDGDAVYAYSPNKVGLRAISNSQTGYGVYASNINGGYALGVSGNLRIFGGNTNPGAGKVLTSDALGNATWQSSASSNATIGFIVNNSAQGGLQNMPNGVMYKLHGGIEEYDGSGNYTLYNQTPSSTFTATVAGMYRFRCDVTIAAPVNALLEYAHLYLVVKRGSTETTLVVKFNSAGGGSATSEIDRTVFLNSGDQVWLKAQAATDNNTNPWVNFFHFSGYRIK